MNPTRTRAPSKNGKGSATARPRVRGSVRGGAAPEAREAQYDLLTAALLGLAIGAGTTLLLRRGPSGERPIGPAWRMASKSARAGARLAGRGAHAAWEGGTNLWDRIPRQEIQEHLHGYFESARETLDNLVESELKDLRRAIHRRRKKLGF